MVIVGGTWKVHSGVVELTRIALKSMLDKSVYQRLPNEFTPEDLLRQQHLLDPCTEA